jgi:hypothetical protein
VTPSLPANPSLRFLKEQAKDFLKAHKAGDASSCQVLRNLGRFAAAADADILAADVPLKEVQFALAMHYGFKSWDEMKKHVELAEQACRHLGHWQRFGGDEGEKIQMVLRDPQWVSLLRREDELAPLSDQARVIRERIASMEPCHACYGTNVQRVLGMIGSMRPDPIFDCGEADEQRKGQAQRYRVALQSWLASADGDGSADLPGFPRYLGRPDETKRALVVHLIRKLEDNRYHAYPWEQEDFTKAESRITHLEICCHYWEQSILVLLQEIGAGKRLCEWHKPDGFNACGDAPDRVAQLGEFLRSAHAWLDGDADGAGPTGQILGERTPEKCWLLESLCKHIRSAAQQARILE